MKRQLTGVDFLSGFSLIGLLAYLAVAVLALATGALARRFVRPADQVRGWILLAVWFVCLAAYRGFAVEDAAKALVRGRFRESGVYADRWYVQAPTILLVMLLVTVLAYAAFRVLRANWQRRGKAAMLIAQVAAAAHVPLSILRIVSLNTVDKLLYRGSLRLNWLLELAMLTAVFVCAAWYIRNLFRMRSLNAARAPFDRRQAEDRSAGSS
ncbi:hypothetical protein [Aurantiacibacter spongiae]|uniref:Uncharacterized protein n=1 Tax=Aurantiacibacter spongiae TaxID=2488860 RepID=A0A3N5DL70_9SPHN|nr:hypothetical protein [Aurantiacibacter spongiae]RPF71515.1 hypothetical protein EG799_07725 [Aurantiacibacter spongiae]